LGIWPQTVTKWRKRFLDRRLDGLADEPRPGAPRQITDEQIEDVIVKTLEATPANATHWSRASMAAQSGLSKSTIGRVWKAFGLKPHLVDTFKLSNDPQFIDKVRDLVGALSGSPGQGPGPGGGREIPDPSLGPLRAGAGDDARHARTAHP
jgi:hypothetical protein